MVQKKITRDMLIGEVVREHPETALVMVSHGLHCVGCHVAAFETIEQGCRGHGMNDEQIDQMIKEMNEAVEGLDKADEVLGEMAKDLPDVAEYNKNLKEKKEKKEE